MDKIENAPQPSHDTLLVTPAPPALPPEHISAPQPKKSHKLLVVILIVVILCIIAAVVAVVLIQKNTASETKNPETSATDEYTYKIRYDFGTESYIILTKNNDIKLLYRTEIYETQPECNCMRATGKFDEKTTIVNFKDEVKAEVIAVMKELAEKAGKNEFNADDMELTSYQQKVLLSTITNSQDWLTLENDIKFKTETDGKITYTIIDAEATENDIVKNIANYINDIVDHDYKALKQYNNGSELHLELVYVGPFFANVYFYKIDENGKKYDARGYVFDGNGGNKEFDMRGRMSEYHAQAVENFKKSDYYAKYQKKMVIGWEDTLKSTMFNTGFWYQIEGGVKFIVRAGSISSNGAIPEDYEIFIETDGDP